MLIVLPGFFRNLTQNKQMNSAYSYPIAPQIAAKLPPEADSESEAQAVFKWCFSGLVVPTCCHTYAYMLPPLHKKKEKIGTFKSSIFWVFTLNRFLFQDVEENAGLAGFHDRLFLYVSRCFFTSSYFS